MDHVFDVVSLFLVFEEKQSFSVVGCLVVTPSTCACELIWKKGFGDVIKNVKMR